MSSLRKSISSGIFYTALAKYSNVIVSIIITAILARLLTPAEYGIIAIIMVFISFFNLLGNLGLGPAIVQNKSLTEQDLESIFTFSLAIGILLAILFFSMAPLLASYYNDERLIDLSRLMALSILFHSFQVIPHSLNLKKLRFKQIGLVTVAVSATGGIVAIILAYLGFSYYALVWNSITSGLLMSIAFYVLAPVKLKFKIDLDPILKIAKFSIFQFSFSFINYFSRNTDNLFIPKYFDEEALGFYDKAYRLMMMPVQQLTHVITPVLHPVLSNFQNDKSLVYNTYYKVVKLLSTIGFPLSVFLFFSGTEIVNIFFGPQWDQSIPIFRLLALTVGIQMVLSSTGSIFQATNRTDLMFYAGLIGAIVMIGGICYGIFIGKSLTSIGYGLILAFCINILQALYLLIKKSLKFPYLKFMKVFIFPICMSTIIGFILWLVNDVKISNIFLSFIFKASLTITAFSLTFSFSKENRVLFNDYFRNR